MDYYDKTVNDIVLWHRIGAIVCHIAKKLGIPPIQALKDFYRSQTCLNLHNRKTMATSILPTIILLKLGQKKTKRYIAIGVLLWILTVFSQNFILLVWISLKSIISLQSFNGISIQI